MRTKLEPEANGTAPPEGSPEEVAWARQQARRASRSILVPFLLLVVLGVLLRLYSLSGAVADLTSLARKTDPQGAPQPISSLAHRLSEEVYGHEHHDEEVERYERLVRVIANRVNDIQDAEVQEAEKRPDSWLFRVSLQGNPCAQASGRAVVFCRETYVTMLANLWFPASLYAMLILFFPSLFIASFWRAAQGVEKGSALVRKGFSTFASEVWYRRYRSLLEDQSHSFFWRRAGFAFLIGYGSLYLVAPLGMKAMTIGEYLAMHAIPGEATYPYLLSAFERAQPFTIGFAGYFLYALTGFVRRYATHDLHDRIFMPLFIRGITVVLLSWVLATLGEEGGLSRVLVFAAGVFPQAGLQAIAKMTQTTVDRLSAEGTSGFKTIPEIDFWKETTLQEIGINDFNDLAKADLRELLVALGMNPAVLARAADRAVLVQALGAEAADKLAAVPLYTASEVVLYTRGADAWTGVPPEKIRYKLVGALTEDQKQEREKTVEKVLGAEDICLQLDQLATEGNVRYVIESRLAYGSL